MAQEKDRRFSQITKCLEQHGYALRVSETAGFWTVMRDGRSICQLNGEKLIYDDNVYADESVQAHFNEVLQLVHSI